ncbi:MAG: hypothetical protein JSR87_08390 [Proteobacteria bacterium]|nr:hypothetical protein [Pseudomonadota bacterium]MBS0572758.1 hypothetical protein [Pseudomonadota bacterium]
MTERRDDDMADLDRLFALARKRAPEPPPELVRRVGRAGVALQPAPARPGARAFWPRLLQGAGGWPGLGGMAAAGVVGLVFGLGGLIGPVAADEGAGAALSLLPGGASLEQPLLGAGDE